MVINEDKNRISTTEIEVLKAMFEDREGAVEIIRKIFFPELATDNPLQMNKNMFIDLDFEGMSPEAMVIAVLAQQKLVKHVEGCLSVIKALVGKKEESAEQVIARLTKNSAK